MKLAIALLFVAALAACGVETAGTAATAASTSACPLDGNSPMTSSRLAGLCEVKVLPERAATHSPAMRFWKVVNRGLQGRSRCGKPDCTA